MSLPREAIPERPTRRSRGRPPGGTRAPDQAVEAGPRRGRQAHPGAPAVSKRWLWLAPLVALALFAAWRVATRAWLCDDSFISLRYVENLVHGHGLVYNPGERVEGYTSFLWVVGLAGLVVLGIPPEGAALLLGVASYALLVAVLLGWWVSHRDEGPGFPVAAGLVLALEDFHIWATGGLETTAFTVLVLGGLLLASSRRPSSRRDLIASTLLGLAVLTRPDGMLFLLGGLTCPWWAPRPSSLAARLRRTALLLAPAAVLVAGQAAFKLAFYGELLPTAFYSKSPLRPYYSQGALYVSLWLAKNWALLPVAGVALALNLKRGGPGRARPDTVFLTLAGLVFVAYVVHSGGDFMFARRLIPALPLFFLGLERVLARLGRTAPQHALLGVLLLGALLPFPLYGPQRPRISGIADEPRFYPAEVVRFRRRQGEAVGSLLARTPARVMFEGGMCSFGYYSRLPYLIEMTGLTQYSLAKLPLRRRGWIGHEKQPDARWLDDNGVNLIVSHDLPPRAPGPSGMVSDQIYFGGLVNARIWRYSDAVMDALRDRPDVTFVPIEQVFDSARASVGRGSREETRHVFEYLDRYYFHSGGPGAEAAAEEFRTLLRAKEAAPRP